MSAPAKTGGAQFDPARPFIYFIASNIERAKYGVLSHAHVLAAVNEINTSDDAAIVQGWIGKGVEVLIDSGIFFLTMSHARAHPGTSMDEALALAPEAIDGFDDLFERYVACIRQFGEDAWGYIELDQGGRENKIRTRTRLEQMGLHPIPVYHPLNDGWEYFDYLAERYDRICFGNLVHASPGVRKRLLATAWSRKCAYPDLWIHLLGLTPNEWLNAYPISSGDSSTWLSSVRWSGYTERTDGATLGHVLGDFQYVLGSDPAGDTGSRKGTRMAAYGSYMAQKNWQAHLRDLESVGCVIYPQAAS